MQTQISPIQYRKTVEGLLGVLPKRYKIVIARRFGLKNRKPETLEHIGKDYKITRERVRQIEEAALKQIRNSKQYEELSSDFARFKNYMDIHGGIVKESEIIAELAGSFKNYPHLNFLMELSGQFKKVPESRHFYSFWMRDENSLARAKNALKSLIAKLEENGRPHTDEEFKQLYREDVPLVAEEQIEEPALQSYLAVSKEICQGPFGHFGLRHWPEINPRGIKDKAYLVFKREQRPLHFKVVSDLIDKTSFPRVYLGSWRKNQDLNFTKALKKKTNPQTIHNELIKDQRFVLVGRGLYALKEWGYSQGVVKDVIKKVLADNRQPMDKDEIIKKVLDQRFVKAGTVLCNLQDKNCFKKTDDGKYGLIA